MLTLSHSSWLLLAPVAMLILALASRSSPQTLGRLRRAASLAVRSLLVLVLTFALGGPVFTRIASLPRSTVFLLDVSESLPKGSTEKALVRLRPIWNREVAAGERCALVAFAGRARVLIPPSTLPLAIDSVSPPESIGRSSTDFCRALETARSLFREHAANRIVVLTDGLDTTRPAREVDLPASTLGVSLADPGPLEVAIAEVRAPLAVRSGEPFDARVTLTTNRACEVGLRTVIDDVALAEAPAKFRLPGPGRHVVVLPHLQQARALETGVRRLTVIAEAPGDRESRNNVAQTAVTVTGKPRVLLVQGSPSDGEFLSRVLKTQDIEFDRQSPAEFTSRADSLEGYVAVILAGVAREALGPSTVAALRGFVERTGGGLFVVGSPSLQGRSGYAGSDLESMLPVVFTAEATGPAAPKSPEAGPPPPVPPPPAPFDPDDAKAAKVLAPSVALLLIVDKSGSMAGRNIELVKEACIAAARALGPRDEVAVLAFDYNPRLLLEWTEAERIDYITQRILRLLADGGTRIYPALVEGLRFFQDPRAQRCAVKHAVLLSDGDAPGADYQTVVERMVANGITVSTVCVSGPNFDAVVMSQIASWGKGRFRFTNSFQNVPLLITTETQKVLATIPKGNRELPPALPPKNSESPPPAAKPPAKPEKPPPLESVVTREAHEILAGIAAKDLPGLRGRLGAAARPKVDVPLMTLQGKPVLALGRLGLGKTAVWASDLAGAWSPEWLQWKDGPKFFAQLIRYVSGSGPDAELASRVRIARDGPRRQLRIDSTGAGGAITVTDVSRAESRPLPFDTNDEGESVISLPLDHPGDLRLLLQRADGKKLQLGLTRGYDEEFAPPEPARDLFSNGLAAVRWEDLEGILAQEHLTGEERQDLTPWLAIAALALLPVDVALRRLMTR